MWLLGLRGANFLLQFFPETGTSDSFVSGYGGVQNFAHFESMVCEIIQGFHISLVSPDIKGLIEIALRSLLLPIYYVVVYGTAVQDSEAKSTLSISQEDTICYKWGQERGQLRQTDRGDFS